MVYLDEKTMPKDSEGSTGSSYIVDRKNRKVLIPIDVNKIEDIKELLGTLTEEVAHGKDALEGRQDKKVAEDKSNDEEGLESLGRPANEYVKKKFGEDNNSKIKLTTDGIDLSNADVGEKVGDVITSGDREERTRLQEERPINKKTKKALQKFLASGRVEQISSGFLDAGIGGVTAIGGISLTVGTGAVDIVSGGTTFIFTLTPKVVGVAGIGIGGSRFWVGVKKIKNGIFGEKVEYQTHPIRDSKVFEGYEDFYDMTEVGITLGVSLLINSYPIINTQENLKKSQINTSFRGQKTPISSTRSLTDGKNYNVIKEISQGKVFINNGKPGETTMAYQKRITYSNGSMRIFQENLTTGEISLQKINPLGQRISETSLTPYEANTLIGVNSSSKMLVGNGAVSQVASKVGQVQNNRLPYKPVLALPVKYPIKSESGVTIYKDYAIGLRGGKYVEAGITKENKIAYRNNGSYYVVGQGDDGFKNVPATDVTTNYLISAPGGRKGSPETKAQINAIIDDTLKIKWIHVAGGDKSEEYLSASKLGNKSTKDSNYIDITLQKVIEGKKVTVRINTVDTYKNGNLTKREAEAARSINLKIIGEGKGNPQLITIPKGQGTGNIGKILKKIEEDIEKNTK